MGETPKPHFSYFLRREERSKEASTPSKASPYMGKMQHEKLQRPTTFLCFSNAGHALNLLSIGEVDTIVLGEVLDGVRGEFTGEGADAHRGENRATCGEITPEGAIRNTCELG